MGLDKLKVITGRRPQQSFIDLLNDEVRKKPEERHFEMRFRYDPGPDPTVRETTPLVLWTKPKITPFFRVELQVLVPGGRIVPRRKPERETQPVQCQHCKTTWSYNATIPAPGGPIGILSHLENLGCPECGTLSTTDKTDLPDCASQFSALLTKPEKRPPLTTVETNPNRFPDGYKGVALLLEIVFGEAFPDLKISRIDCNADLPDVSVEHIRSSLRIPGKRKTGDVGRLHESYSSCGVQTFYVGKRPAQLRVYDKIEELRHKDPDQDISQLPPVLTRLEWEFHERRCPVRYWGDLPQILDLQPFGRLQFLETEEQYNFRYDAKHSLSLFAYNKLAKEKGAHEATRIFNKACGRHFSRYLNNDVLDNRGLRDRVHHTWHASTRAFFENRCADVRALYFQAQQELMLNGGPPIEFEVPVGSKPLLGTSEAEANAIAAAGRRLEVLQEARVFDTSTLLESPIFEGSQLQMVLGARGKNVDSIE